MSRMRWNVAGRDEEIKEAFFFAGAQLIVLTEPAN